MPASNVTVSALFVSDTPVLTTHRIILSQTANGTISTNVSSAVAGTIITITDIPSNGYELQQYTVRDETGNVLFTSKDLSFTMPASDITITPLFQRQANPFSDVYPGAYYEAILWAYRNGVTLDVTTTTFAPAITCSRAQAVTFLWRAAGSPEPTASRNPFIDVQSTAYFYKAVIWAVEKGITTGRSTTEFAPDEPVSRANVVTFLYRMDGAFASNFGIKFPDVNPNAYYANAVSWAMANGIAQGFSDSTFRPNDSCTRGQIVTFLYRYFV